MNVKFGEMENDKNFLMSELVRKDDLLMKAREEREEREREMEMLKKSTGERERELLEQVQKESKERKEEKEKWLSEKGVLEKSHITMLNAERESHAVILGAVNTSSQLLTQEAHGYKADIGMFLHTILKHWSILYISIFASHIHTCI